MCVHPSVLLVGCHNLFEDFCPRSPGTHIVGSWVIDSISLYRVPRTGTQYIGNWASRAVDPPIRP